MQYELELEAFRAALDTKLRLLGEEFGYVFSKGNNPYLTMLKHPAGHQVYVYHRDRSMVDNKYTVTTQLTHPKFGRTQMHRRHCSMEQVKKLLENPRMHTGKGYRKKANLLRDL